MTFWFTLRETFDDHEEFESGRTWPKYIQWSRLSHLTEVISLDSSLNADLLKIEDFVGDFWTVAAPTPEYSTTMVTSLDFLIQELKYNRPKPLPPRFNLLAVAQEPPRDMSLSGPEGFEFIGYDLLDKCYDVSALTNCGGFDETFQTKDQNKCGLINHFQKAVEIKEKLKKNNPDEPHADCYLFAVFRHKTIGRIGST
jgi:hypothetical protein